MRVIDAHVHFSRIASFQEAAEKVSGCDYSLSGLQEELNRSNVQAAVAMGLQETVPYGFPDATAPNPMGLDLSDSLPENVYFCAGINPYDLSKASLQRVEETLRQARCAGIKLYPGYYPVSVNDPVYEPIYEMAYHYDLPVVIHSGDTFSERGLLQYAHPLAIDTLAVTHRKITIVIAHLGDPWVKDAAEIVRKNSNVYADISGFLVGNRSSFKEQMQEHLIMNEFSRALYYAGQWEKILYGSDWPLAPIDVYLHFVERIVPEKHLEKVCGENALSVFTRIKG